jgi:hypothetical protein
MFTRKFFVTLFLSSIVGTLVTFVAVLFSNILYALTLGPGDDPSPVLAMFFLVIVWILLIMSFIPSKFLPRSREVRVEIVLILVLGMVANQFTPMIEGSLLLLSTLIVYHGLVVWDRSDDKTEQ